MSYIIETIEGLPESIPYRELTPAQEYQLQILFNREQFRDVLAPKEDQAYTTEGLATSFEKGGHTLKVEVFYLQGREQFVIRFSCDDVITGLLPLSEEAARSVLVLLNKSVFDVLGREAS